MAFPDYESIPTWELDLPALQPGFVWSTRRIGRGVAHVHGIGLGSSLCGATDHVAYEVVFAKPCRRCWHSAELFKLCVG